MADQRYLERRAQGWYCVKDVPRKLREALGCKRHIRSLGTRSLTVAQARRWAILGEFQKVVDEAAKRGTIDPNVQMAFAVREQLQAIDRGEAWAIDGFAECANDNENDLTGEPGDAQATARFEIMSYLGDTVGELRAKSGRAYADMIGDLALGKVTPLAHHVDAWLAEGGTRGPTKARTQQQYRADLDALDAFLRAEGLPPTIEAVSKQVAGRYVTRGVPAVARKTVNRKVSALSAYWRWLNKRGHVEVNPWSGQSLAKLQGDKDVEPRPFSDGEVIALFTGEPDAELRDAMAVAALSGMRLEEIYRLTVADCAEHQFNIRAAKTKAGKRRVPTHPDLEHGPIDPTRKFFPDAVPI